MSRALSDQFAYHIMTSAWQIMWQITCVIVE